MNVASCTIADCNKPHRARGYCSTHYTRWRSNGDPNIVRPNHFVRGGGYHAIHKWLYRHYGKANRCTNPDCPGTSRRYHWAKLDGAAYEHNRQNFTMLCAQCHRLYDQRPDWIRQTAITMAKHTNHKICCNGHPRTPENTYWAKRKIVTSPVCRVCQRESQRRYVCKSQV